jgi:hypothetical protein
MTIRTFMPGDETAQVGIYNEAAAELPKFKPATLDEIRRRCLSPEFDPSGRLFGVAGNRPVAYLNVHTSGRIGYPWCRKGHEGFAERLLEHALELLRQRRMPCAWTAYRSEWGPQRDFFQTHGFRPVREIINYVMDMVEMPTPAAKVGIAISPLTLEDLPSLLTMTPNVLRARTEVELREHLLHNPWFPPDSVFVLRHRSDNLPRAVAVLVNNPTYAHPKQVDSGMPCFRLGSFGSEGLPAKRINGLFSLLVSEGRDVGPLGLDLLGHASLLLQDSDIECFGAQVASDVPHLARFYKQYFRRQGSFPVFERAL